MQPAITAAFFPALPDGCFFGAALLLRSEIGEKVQLLSAFMAGQGVLRDDVVGGQIQPPDQKIGVYNAVEKLGNGTDDGLGGSGMPAQIRGAVGVLGNSAAVAVNGDGALIGAASFRVGEIFNIVAHRQDNLVGDKSFVH